MHRQNLAEILNRVRGLQPADLALILESLPREQRLVICHFRAEVLLAALGMALGIRQNELRQRERGLVHHSDRGCQYAGDTYRSEREASSAAPGDDRRVPFPRAPARRLGCLDHPRPEGA